jgi:hypothetical protein
LLVRLAHQLDFQVEHGLQGFLVLSDLFGQFLGPVRVTFDFHGSLQAIDFAIQTARQVGKELPRTGKGRQVLCRLVRARTPPPTEFIGRSHVWCLSLIESRKRQRRAPRPARSHHFQRAVIPTRQRSQSQENSSSFL